MRMPWGALCALVVLLSILRVPAASAGTSAVHKALESRAGMEFDEVPLCDAAAWLREKYGINVVLDTHALKAAGVAPHSPVNATLHHCTLGSALRVLLKATDMTYTVRDEVLVLTTQESAEQALHVVVYPVADLLRTRQAEELDPYELLEVLLCTCRPESWEDVGGPGVAKIVGGNLIVAQSTNVHEELAHLLTELRGARLTDPKSRPAESDTVRSALSRSMSLELEKTPLLELAALLRKQAGIDVMVDRRALQNAGVILESTISGSSKLPLGDALTSLLRPLGLAWSVRSGVLLITTVEDAESYVYPRVYDVRTLLRSDTAESETLLTTGELTDLMIRTVEPDSWEEVGGPGSLAPLGDLLVVLQNDAGHRQTDRLLAMLERLQGQAPASAESSVNAALDQRIRCRFEATPLNTALEAIEQQLQVPLETNVRTLAEMNIDGSRPITLELQDVRAEALLDLMLRPLELAWTIHDERLEITSLEDARRRVQIACYPIPSALEDELSYEEAIELVYATVAPESWENVGGNGTVARFRNYLVVLQTPQIQRRIAELFRDLATTSDPSN